MDFISKWTCNMENEDEKQNFQTIDELNVLCDCNARKHREVLKTCKIIPLPFPH